MSKEEAEQLRRYAWGYFELHAKQRMSVFNFFLILAGLLTAGFARSVTGTGAEMLLSAFLGGMLMLVAFIFWRLDRRTGELIKISEEALKSAEVVISGNADPTPEQVFRYEEQQTDAKKGFFSTHLSYSQCLRFVFLLFGVAGATGMIVAVSRL